MFRCNGHRPPGRLGQGPRQAGFTLLEVMVSSLIFGTVSIAVMAAFLFLGTSLTRMSYAQQLEENSRRAFYLFNQDVTKATKVSTASDATLVLSLPTTTSGTHTTTHTVTYSYAQNATSLKMELTRILVDTDTDSATGTVVITSTPVVSRTVLSNLSAFDFNYFNKAGTLVTMNIKGVQFSFTASLGSTISGVSGTSIYRTSAQFQSVSPIVFMRNTAINTLLPP